jgi:hypothetical protein
MITITVGGKSTQAQITDEVGDLLYDRVLVVSLLKISLYPVPWLPFVWT